MQAVDVSEDGQQLGGQVGTDVASAPVAAPVAALEQLLPPPPLPPPAATAPSVEPLAEQLSRGRPRHFATAGHGVAAGIVRQWPAAAIALSVSWSCVWLLLVGAAVFVLVGVIIAVVGAFIGGGAGGLIGILAAAGTTVTSAWAVVMALLFEGPGLLLGVICGAAISLTLFGVMISAEPLLLRLQGHRRLSRREHARLMPLLQEAGRRMNLYPLPPLLMADGNIRNAAAYTRHVVVGRALYDELSDERLAAILAHELHHWARGDTLGLRFVYICGLPLILMFGLGSFLSRRWGVVSIVGWFFLWPSWVLVRLVLEPLMALRGRRYEYEADAAARRAGYGPSLHKALEMYQDFEGGRSGWAEVIQATHPPTELRLEALEV